MSVDKRDEAQERGSALVNVDVELIFVSESRFLPPMPVREASPDEGHQAPGARLVRPVGVAEVVDEHLLFGDDPVDVHAEQ